jgi:putative transcriptional regulator
MKKEHFNQLIKSIHQMGNYLKGKNVSGVRVSQKAKPLTSKDIKEIRVKVLHVTQETFAQIVGEGLGAVRTWEQGTSHPGGAAAKIIRLIKLHPERAKELLSV